LKKCIPTTRSGKGVNWDNFSMGREEVFDATIVFGETIIESS